MLTRIGAEGVAVGLVTRAGRAATTGGDTKFSIPIPPVDDVLSRPIGPGGSIENDAASSLRFTREVGTALGTKTRREKTGPLWAEEDIRSIGAGSGGFGGAFTLTDFQ
jgi:hypothetical protein